MSNFTSGIAELDSLLGSALSEGTLIVIAGNLGSGKTTLASSICYWNALKGHKCLYISLQEDKDKLFKYVKNFGMDFKELEDKNLLKFIKLPLVITKDSAIDIFSKILKDVTGDFNPRIVVVDTITPILRVVGSDVEARATLQNSLYELPKLINGLAIVIFEVESGNNDLGDIGFVSDVVILMDCKIVNNLMLRHIEIRKSRGVPTKIAKTAFTIRDNEGIKVLVPPMLDDIPAPDYAKPYKHLCRSLDRKVGSIHPGEFILAVHPNLAHLNYVLAYITLMAIIYRAKVLIVSYLIPPKYIIHLIRKSLEKLTAESDITEELVYNYVRIEGLNPSAHIPEEATYKILKLLREYKPNIVVFIGTPPLGITPVGSGTDFKNLTINLIFYLKMLHTVTLIIDVHGDELVKSLSDMIINVRNTSRSKILRVPRVSVGVLRKSEVPKIITLKDFILCTKDLRGILEEGKTLLLTNETSVN